MQLESYLESSRYCDVLHKNIQTKAHCLKKSTRRESAISIWNYISLMPYRLRRWDILASDVLTMNCGMCGNKANLQVALLRALSIPAAFGWMKISKESFKKSCPKEFYDQITPVTDHIFTYVYLNNTWIPCDATPERSEQNIALIDNDPRLGKWDGEQALVIPEQFIIEDLGFFANLDDFFATKSRFSNEELARVYG